MSPGKSKVMPAKLDACLALWACLVFSVSAVASPFIQRLAPPGESQLDERGLPREMKPTATDRVTPEALAAQREGGVGHNFRNPIQSSEQSGPPLARTPYQGSSILSFRDMHTVVPEGAVLWIPERVSDRVVADAGESRFVPWPAFLRANQAWIRTMPLTLDEARDLTPFTEEQQKHWESGGQIVIATLRGNPLAPVFSPPALSATPSNPSEP